jgi:HlyD family secretion protein
MKRHRRFLLLSLLLVIAAALLYTYLQSRSHHTANVIHVSGNIEITDAEVSFKIAGRVEKRLVSEGETVAKGAIVALLDSTDLADEVAMRKAELWEATPVLPSSRRGIVLGRSRKRRRLCSRRRPICNNS